MVKEARSVEVLTSTPFLPGGQPLPAFLSLPLPRGAVRQVDELCLLDEARAVPPQQIEVVERWPDGSLRWAHLRALLTRPADRLELGATTAHRSDEAPMGRVLEDEGIEIENGLCAYRFDRNAVAPLELHESAAGSPLAAGAALRIVEEAGHELELDPGPPRLRENGPLYAEVSREAIARDSRGRERARVEITTAFYRHSPLVRLAVGVTNPRQAAHRGGKWQLGSRGSLYLRELTLSMELAGGPTIHLSPQGDCTFNPLSEPVELAQWHSGGENRNSRVHLDRHGRLPFRDSSGHVGTDDERQRISPQLVARSDRGMVGLAVDGFWQRFPKRVAASPERIEVGLLPLGQEHELQGGERITEHLSLFLDPRPDAPVPSPEIWHGPVHLRLAPSWYAEARVVPHLVTEADDPNRDYVDLVHECLDGESNFFEKRETIDEYGWRHFGDLWADHEQVYSSDPAPLVSHYNNQYDAIFGFGVHFLRSGDERWISLMEDLARHVVDIDLYHTDRDKSAYNGALFWHSYHYVDAGLSSHRSYPNDPRVLGGGPSAGHAYTSGLLLHYHLTGSRRSRDAVLQLGEWVIAADDGRRTVFRWLDRSATGHISATGDDDHHEPGRSAGNALNVLVDCHRLSGDERFLDKAHELIRRTIHPEDPLPGDWFSDIENRWSYTIFLQALGKYLDHGSALGRVDSDWLYARAALLSWARWAAKEETPYLEQPERLEYPTETWAAQELQKTLVFQVAFRYESDPQQRAVYRERARHFFDVAISSLRRLPTHVYTRPRVLLLTKGFSQAAFDLERVVPVSSPSAETPAFPPKTHFVPQKTRALAKAKLLSAALAMLLLVLAVLAILWR